MSSTLALVILAVAGASAEGKEGNRTRNIPLLVKMSCYSTIEKLEGGKRSCLKKADTVFECPIKNGTPNTEFSGYNISLALNTVQGVGMATWKNSCTPPSLGEVNFSINLLSYFERLDYRLSVFSTEKVGLYSKYSAASLLKGGLPDNTYDLERGAHIATELRTETGACSPICELAVSNVPPSKQNRSRAWKRAGGILDTAGNPYVARGHAHPTLTVGETYNFESKALYRYKGANQWQLNEQNVDDLLNEGGH